MSERPAPSSSPLSSPGRGIGPGDTVLLADIGNSRIKLARIDEFAAAGGLPSIARRQDFDSLGFHPDTLERWLLATAPGPAVILVASVYEAAAARLEATVAEISATKHRPIRQRRIGHLDLPLVVALEEPHKVGIDRLAAAAAASLVKPAGRPAVVVDCGTALTVDLVAADGRFLGGAILPGPALMARALAEGTSKLPAVNPLAAGEVAAMPGRCTQAAIAAGIGHGIRGAVSRLVAEARAASGGDAATIVTGGWADAIRAELPDAIAVPDLVLTGIALGAARACAR